jgi:hypothetical protein
MDSPTLLENMKYTTQAILKAFNDLDFSPFRDRQADDFVYQFLPKSLAAPPRNKQKYSEYFPMLTQLYTEFNVCTKEQIVISSG